MSSVWQLGHIKVACRSRSTQKSCNKMDGNKKSFIKDRRVHQMSAAKQNVSSSDSCDDYEWSDGLHTGAYGRRSFSCAGPALWNELPEDIRMTAKINTFKAKRNTHYFKVAFN